MVGSRNRCRKAALRRTLVRAPILLVTATPRARESLQKALRELGVLNPVVAAGGTRHAQLYFEGRGFYRDRRRYPLPAIVLLDLSVSRLRASGLMCFLRSRPETRTLPIVLLGRSPSGDIVRWAYMSGANSYVVLPQDAEMLAERLRDLIAYWMKFNRNPRP